MDFSYLDDWMDEELGGEAIEEGGEGYRNIWALAEVAGGEIAPASLEALGQARELADQIGVYVYGVLLGPEAEPLAEKLFAYGADKVLMAGDPALAQYQPGLYVEAMARLVDQYRPEILLMGATSLGSDLAPALAGRLNTGLMSRCVKLGLDMSERLLLGTFPVLGGEMYNTAACPEARPQLATLLPGHFAVPYEDTYRTGTVEQVELELDEPGGKLTWVDGEAAVELPPVPLVKARVVVSAGRGMGDAQGFALVQKLADALSNERTALSADEPGTDPELVVVFDLVGSVDGFLRAVRDVEGLDFLADLVGEDAEPDDDFFQADKSGERTDKALRESLYMVMTNEGAVEEIVRLFDRWVDDPAAPFATGMAPLKDVFANLRSVRRWGPQDRVREVGLLNVWEETLKTVGLSGSARVEVELWYRNDPSHRAAAEAHVRNVITEGGGTVLRSIDLEAVSYTHLTLPPTYPV